MVRTYILKGKKANLEIKLQYSDGFLTFAEMTFKDRLNERLHQTLFGSVPFDEKNLKILYNLGLKESNDKSPHQKIAMFCDKYMEHKEGRKYKATGTDGRRLQEYALTYEILDAFFKSDHWKIKGVYTIQNLLSNWNIVLEEMATGNKSKYPDEWIEKYEATLNQQQISEYWAHLRGLGLVAKKDRLGKTTDWIKKDFDN